MDEVPACCSAQLFNVTVDRGGAVIAVSGALDLATRNDFITACRSAGAAALVIDMADLVFMDCRGWGGVVEAGRDVASVMLRGACGQPAHLIDLIRTLERSP